MAHMRYPGWFKAQLVEAVIGRGLSYAHAGYLYGVGDETIRNWVNAAGGKLPELERVEALEHRLARIEHYLVLGEAIREQVTHHTGHSNGRDGSTSADDSAAAAVARPAGRGTKS